MYLLQKSYDKFKFEVLNDSCFKEFDLVRRWDGIRIVVEADRKMFGLFFGIYVRGLEGRICRNIFFKIGSTEDFQELFKSCNLIGSRVN